MDDDDSHLRNWGYYEPHLKHLGLQLMSSVAEQRDTKPFLPTHHRENPVILPPNGNSFHHHHHHPRDSVVTEPPVTHMDYVRDSWINNRNKFLPMFANNPYTSVLPPEPPSMQMVLQPDHATTKETKPTDEEEEEEEEAPPPPPTGSRSRKRGAAAPLTPKTPKAKKPRKNSTPKENNGNSSTVQRAKTVKKNVEVVINGIDMDITGIPIPVCSCTGGPQQCYRWGCGGWQSACCTTTISMYPLPMSTKRRGARIAGRKMSQGAFKKVLEKLAGEGYDFANPIDLRTYWAKHGTNKFVIIR